MISIMNYLYEGQILDHLKRNKGKYALGAIGLGVGALGAGAGLIAAPEALSQYHNYAAEKLKEEAENVYDPTTTMTSEQWKNAGEYLTKQLHQSSAEQQGIKLGKLIAAQKHAEKHLEWKESPINLYKHRNKI